MNLRSPSLSSSSLLHLRPQSLLLRSPCALHDVLLLRRRRRRIQAVPSLSSLVPRLPIAVHDAAIAVAAAAAAAAAALLISSRRVNRSGDGEGDEGSAVGDWILFASPTPFNRIVLLRCPSVAFDDGGDILGGGVDERLVLEKRHSVVPCRRRNPASGEDAISYQRVCVGTEDGGVIAIDWPDNLELGREDGLDTTVLVVPGTVEGSMEWDVKVFVRDALQKGYFPVVMNPRGCGGSPLTTSRLFTAGDSDDICTAVQFIRSSRPWSTILGVGWGYGANMLTKYLSEVRDTASMAAAVCVDSPFDLDEATNLIPHHIAMDQKLIGGLRDIVRANKELFQGKTKGFDVAKALSATSIRDFDKAVSMVSYGFDVLEDFYMKLSTREFVGGLKIPILFIQSDDGMVPQFSVPHSSIAENPCTSLLSCSFFPSTLVVRERSSISWCQHIAFEWLSSVELALLKGFHPSLKDVETIAKPSKGVIFSEHGLPGKSFPSEHRTPIIFLEDKNGGSNGVHLVRQDNNAEMKEDSSVENINYDGGFVKGGENSTDNDHGQILQASAVVLNMLDVTMPGVVNHEQKEKVLTAIGHGETLLGALEEAVPKDVRGNLTNALTEILQTPNNSLNLEDLRRIGWMPKLSSDLKLGVQENLQGVVHGAVDGTLHPFMSTDTIGNASPGNIVVSDRTDSSTSLQEGTNLEISSSQNQHSNIENEGTTSRDVTASKEAMVNQNNKIATKKSARNLVAVNGVNETIVDETKEVISENEIDKPSPAAIPEESLSPIPLSNQNNKIAIESSARNLVASNVANEINVDDTKEVSSENEIDKTSPAAIPEVSLSPISLSNHFICKNVTEKHNQDIAVEDTKDRPLQDAAPTAEVSPQHESPKSPSVSIGKALDTLTGLDDSTQIAMSSVFEVIENMIDEFEKVHDKENGDKLVYSIKNALLQGLKLEASRQLGMASLEGMQNDLMNDIVEVADAVARAVVHQNALTFSEASDKVSNKIGRINGEHAIKVISAILQDASHLRKVLPVGVVVGITLAILRKYFVVVALNENIQEPLDCNELVDIQGSPDCRMEKKLNVQMKVNNVKSADALKGDGQCLMKANLSSGVMFGAVTAALGASALLVNHQNDMLLKHGETVKSSNFHSNDEILTQKIFNKLEFATKENKPDKFVSTLAKKAMAVAAPVVPTKSDGEVDKERLVAILAGLGQKGGMFRIVGKMALLWGGISGALSLTDRLISFLHIAERPLMQRIVGFVFMVFVLWSPVVIPLLPALMQSWTMKASNAIVECTCVLGLYVALMILVILWGRRIRGYDDPFEQYGLGIVSAPRACGFLVALVGGVMMVLCVHCVNAILGYASFSWPLGFLPLLDNMLLLKSFANILLLALRGLTVAFGIAVVEELLFRSWLPEEVAVDFGYGCAIITSGLVFALIQRSICSVPGFLLLSFALSGIKQRAHGNLFAPIGLRLGIMTTTFILENSGLLSYHPNVPFWVTGPRPLNPFDGAIGLCVCFLLSVFFYPWFHMKHPSNV